METFELERKDALAALEAKKIVIKDFERQNQQLKEYAEKAQGQTVNKDSQKGRYKS